jgi:N6-adenosine-specific RNA methylase IME4
MYSAKGYEKSPQEHYDCMSIDALKALRDPIVFATAPNAVGIMWATFALLPAALDFMRTVGLSVQDRRPVDQARGQRQSGDGHRLCSAQRRRVVPDRHPGRTPDQEQGPAQSPSDGRLAARRPEDIDSIIVDSLRREHSRKPDEMIPLIENLFDGPLSRTLRAHAAPRLDGEATRRINSARQPRD